MTAPIHQEVEFNAPPAKVYEALMDQSQHTAFTGGPAEISRDVGGSFACHGGQVVGCNVELVPNKRIVQAWRIAAWEEGVYSILSMRLEAAGDKTKLILDQSGVPNDAREHIDAGWDARYWGPLRKFLS